MKNLKIYLSLFFIAFLFASCEDKFSQVVEVDLPEHEPMLSVSAHFTNFDSLLKVGVSKTWGLNEEPPAYFLDNASIKLFKNDVLVSEFKAGEGTYYGFYCSEKQFPWETDGGVFRLEVAVPNLPTVSATQVIPKEIPIIEASYEVEGTISPDGEKVDEVVISFNDPPGEENYYGFRAFGETSYYDESNDTTYTDEYMVYLETVDPLAEEGESGILLLSDAAFDGKKQTLRCYTYDYGYGKKFYVHLVHLTKEKYRYLRSLRQYQDADGNPFAEPVTVSSNIENGTGIFSMETVNIVEIEP